MTRSRTRIESGVRLHKESFDHGARYSNERLAKSQGLLRAFLSRDDRLRSIGHWYSSQGDVDRGLCYSLLLKVM